MITLDSKIYEVTKILKKTKAHFFIDLVVGDLVKFSLPLKRAERCSRGGSYATYVTVTNLKTNAAGSTSLNQLSVLDNFELQELHETA